MSEEFSLIRASYGRMMFNVRKSIRNSQIDFEDLTDFTITCNNALEERVSTCSDVSSVLRVIEKRECSLIDTGLISAVVEEFRITEAEKYIEDYKRKLTEFCSSISVTLCLKEKFGAVDALQCETATYVFDWRPDENKLKDITDILSKTSGKLVKIKFIDTGYSIIVTCSFPSFIIGALIVKLIENFDVLVKNGLKKLTIGCCTMWEKQKIQVCPNCIILLTVVSLDRATTGGERRRNRRRLTGNVFLIYYNCSYTMCIHFRLQENPLEMLEKQILPVEKISQLNTKGTSYIF